MFTFIHKQKISSLSIKKKSYENLFISLLMQQLSHWLLCQFKKKNGNKFNSYFSFYFFLRR